LFSSDDLRPERQIPLDRPSPFGQVRQAKPRKSAHERDPRFETHNMAAFATKRRRGASAVEAAIVLPVFLVFVFGLFEYCHIQMVSNLLKSSCRAAARFGATEGRTNAETSQLLWNRMSPAVAPNSVAIAIKDASGYDTGDELPDSPDDYQNMPDLNLLNAEPRQLFVVRATVNYNDAAILSLPWMGNITLAAQAFMRHE
jgi:Flp pilus assembly protein TadG